jgi:putative inorganic carbon (HCO3(-)) transporter
LPIGTATVVKELKSAKVRSKFAYRVMLLFSFLYFCRPEDVIPGLSIIPLAKITGAIALLALLMGSSGKRRDKFPVEIKLIFALFAWLILTIPFASWRGGSFYVVFLEFSKAVVIALALTISVSEVVELRRLISVQAFGVAVMSLASILVNNRVNGRLAGIGDGLVSNPNDLAINIALTWPLCFAFLLNSRGVFKRIFWGLSMLGMVYAVMATYSRSGFLALSIGATLCLWDFGIKGKRLAIVAGAVLCSMMLLTLAPHNYSKRLETLVGVRQRGDKDNGSAEARENLLLDSLEVTATHPIFGVGPGNFASYTQIWRVTHNTYTEFSSECGIPALLIFLFLLKRAFRNVGTVRHNKDFGPRDELRLFAGAVWAGLGAYLVGAFFSSTAYQLFPYYMVTYSILLYKLSTQEMRADTDVKPARRVLIRERVYSQV